MVSFNGLYANHNRCKQANEPDMSRNVCKWWSQERENAGEEMTIFCGFTSNWLGKWCEYLNTHRTL